MANEKKKTKEYYKSKIEGIGISFDSPNEKDEDLRHIIASNMTDKQINFLVKQFKIK